MSTSCCSCVCDDAAAAVPQHFADSLSAVTAGVVSQLVFEMFGIAAVFQLSATLLGAWLDCIHRPRPEF